MKLPEQLQWPCQGVTCVTSLNFKTCHFPLLGGSYVSLGILLLYFCLIFSGPFA